MTTEPYAYLEDDIQTVVQLAADTISGYGTRLSSLPAYMSAIREAAAYLRESHDTT